MKKDFESMNAILTVAEVADILNISYKSTLKLICNKTLPAKKVGRAYRVTKVHLMDYFDLVME